MTQEQTTALADAIRKHNYDHIIPMGPEVIGTLALFCFYQNSAVDMEKWIEYCHTPWGKGAGEYNETRGKA